MLLLQGAGREQDREHDGEQGLPQGHRAARVGAQQEPHAHRRPQEQDACDKHDESDEGNPVVPQ